MQDAPVGVRFADYVSVFSSGQTVAATFDRGLMYARGYAIGAEHKAKGVTAVLGPVAGPLGRMPEGGRNWEGFSPDPYLSMLICAHVTDRETDLECSWRWYVRDCSWYTECRSDCYC